MTLWWYLILLNNADLFNKSYATERLAFWKAKTCFSIGLYSNRLFILHNRFALRVFSDLLSEKRRDCIWQISGFWTVAAVSTGPLKLIFVTTVYTDKSVNPHSQQFDMCSHLHCSINLFRRLPQKIKNWTNSTKNHYMKLGKYRMFTHRVWL